MFPRRTVSRDVAVALLITCILLAVGLIAFIAYDTSIVSDQSKTIANLNATVINDDAQINSLNSQVASQTNQINSLNSQVADLNSIISLTNSQNWINSQTKTQSASSYSYWTFTASYAGYVSVYVQSSTTTNTYAEVVYNSHGINYDQTITVNSGETVFFPILPSSGIQVRIGNTNWFNDATETVTITYYY
jgi:uncharacterized coiled-coil protein SlyX